MLKPEFEQRIFDDLRNVTQRVPRFARSRYIIFGNAVIQGRGLLLAALIADPVGEAHNMRGRVGVTLETEAHAGYLTTHVNKVTPITSGGAERYALPRIVTPMHPTPQGTPMPNFDVLLDLKAPEASRWGDAVLHITSIARPR